MIEKKGNFKNTLMASLLSLTIGAGGATCYFKSKGNTYHWNNISNPAKQEYIESCFPKLESDLRNKLVKNYFSDLPQNTKTDIVLHEFANLPEKQIDRLAERYWESMRYPQKAEYFAKDTWEETKQGVKWLYRKVQMLLKEREKEK